MDDSVCLYAIERPVVNSNVVQAKVYRRPLKTPATFGIIQEAVNVIVNRIVIYHLGYADVMELPGRVNTFQVFRKYLHEHCLADTDTALQEDILMQFVATIRKYILA